MTTKITKDIITAHFETLFAAEARVGAVKALRNLEDPEPPRTRADLAKAWVYLRFTATHEAPRGLPGANGVPWDEDGAFMLMVLVASRDEDALADEIFETAKASLRNVSLKDSGGEDRIDVIEFFGAEAGPKFGGNFWGVSAAAAFETQDI